MSDLPPIPFAEIAGMARPMMLDICRRWVIGGRIKGREYITLNPTRSDRTLGSFRINIVSGAWADFAVPAARGGDAISLGCYLFDWSPVESARHVARMVGHPFGDSQPAKKPDNAAA
mgnify:CR=1 FL=1